MIEIYKTCMFNRSDEYEEYATWRENEAHVPFYIRGNQAFVIRSIHDSEWRINTYSAIGKVGDTYGPYKSAEEAFLYLHLLKDAQ